MPSFSRQSLALENGRFCCYDNDGLKARSEEKSFRHKHPLSGRQSGLGTKVPEILAGGLPAPLPVTHSSAWQPQPIAHEICITQSSLGCTKFMLLLASCQQPFNGAEITL
ncbi:hypothetical protein KIL84_015370 [Mauremys mutica]|uniref:Uncharacterized protein n=1 Tax=Mauremys mutica TaxID=74926 RepID=A0A9D4APQ8_9SAUR|nr:hypothetical protein KIL84_015370 [Mauremys mutica]